MRSHLRRGTAIAAALAIGVFAAACGSDDSGEDAASSAAGAVSAAASSAEGAASSVEEAAEQHRAGPAPLAQGEEHLLQVGEG